LRLEGEGGKPRQHFRQGNGDGADIGAGIANGAVRREMVAEEIDLRPRELAVPGKAGADGPVGARIEEERIEGDGA
jgi:hypothetical protein